MNTFQSRRFIEIESLLNKDRKLPTPTNLIIRINELNNIGELLG